jgi:hypothetical protein
MPFYLTEKFSLFFIHKIRNCLRLSSIARKAKIRNLLETEHLTRMGEKVNVELRLEGPLESTRLEDHK